MNLNVYFDGGCSDNGKESAQAYGSYMVKDCYGWSDNKLRIPFACKTSNQAEYLALIDALTFLHAFCLNIYKETNLEIWTDSMLVNKQLRGQWKVKHPQIKALHSQALSMLRVFQSWQIHWHSRENNVKLFGH